MDATSMSTFSNDDKDRKKRLPRINTLVTLRMNATEEITWCPGIHTGSEPCLSYPRSLHSLPD